MRTAHINILILLAVCITILSSCSLESSSECEIARLTATDFDYFTDSSNSINSIEKEYTDNKANIAKIIKIGEENVTLTYLNSTQNPRTICHVYESQDKIVSCKYYDQTNRLAQMVVKDAQLKPEDNISTEEEYRRWAEALLKTYTNDDLSMYRYSCRTVVGVSKENCAYQDRYDYFYKTKHKDEHISSYSFVYTKYIDEYPTTDSTSLYISRSGVTVIKFDEHKFDEDINIVPDQKKMETSLNSYINTSINTEKYSLESFNITNMRLSYINDKACCIYSVELHLLNNSTKDIITSLANFAVFINEA